MQLKQGLRVVRRAADEVQIGTDARWAVRVVGLTDEQREGLVRLGDRPVDGWLPTAVVDALDRAGLLRPPRARTPRVPPALVPEARGYGLTCDDGDGTDLLRRRHRATVAVTGLDRVGLTAATTLAAAGIGTLVLDDARLVRVADVGAGYRTADVGRPRARVATELIAAQSPDVAVRRPRKVVPDVAVTVATDVTDPGVALGLLSADVPHLPVVTREADALVGPFVGTPGTSSPGTGGPGTAGPGTTGPQTRRTGSDGEPAACLRCVDLHRAAADPAWPAVLAELSAHRRSADPGPPAALAAVTGGIAAAEVLAHVDGTVPRTRGAQYEIPLPGVEPRLRRWAAHPACGCATLAP